MNLGIAGKVALVEGASSGLGLAVAQELAREGAQLILVARNRTRLESVAATLPGSHVVACDILDTSRFLAELDEVCQRVGGPDIVILNGPGPAPAQPTAVTPDAVRSAIDALVLPHVAVLNQALPRMRRRGWGRVVAIGSSAVVEPITTITTSGLGRSALANYLKVLAQELAAEGINIHVVLPGRFSTERVALLDSQAAERRGIDIDDVRAESIASIPAGRYGEPAEFAALVAFLCSRRAAYMTGSMVRCDGGLVRSL